MPFSDIFSIEERCSDLDCNINRKNVKKIFKPDNGLKDKNLLKELFENEFHTGNQPNMCDCIIECDDSNLFIIEILCGTLDHTEFKRKNKQLKNCCLVAKHKNLKDRVKKIVLLYKRLDTQKSPQLRKALLNPKICDKNLILVQHRRVEISC